MWLGGLLDWDMLPDMAVPTCRELAQFECIVLVDARPPVAAFGYR